MARLCAVLLLLAEFSFVSAQQDVPKYKDYAASPEERARDLVSRMTLEEKISQMQNAAAAIPRLDIPAYDWWNEALHGVARAGLATVFPQAIGLGATWDTNLERRIADIISTEARGKYNDAIAHGNHGRYYGLTFWSPNINIFRDPRWGRGQETYGEDPYLTAEMAIQFIEGLQGDDPHYFKTIATSKHFAIHSGPELSRHKFDVHVSDEDLNDTYLYAFRQTVEQAKVDSIMCVYNAVDGVPGCASDFLLKDHLRKQWGFQGYVVSDCDAIEDIYGGHHYAKSPAEASADAVKAGTDLDCGRTYRTLADAVHSSYISEDEINRSVERLFTARFRLGMFDPPDRVPFSKIGLDQVASEAHRRVSLEAAEKSIVLLKNDNQLLPLEKPPRNIAVIGPAADDPDALLGNYNGIPSRIVTPLEGIEREFHARSMIHFALGSTYVADWTALVPSTVLTPEKAGNKPGLLTEYFNNERFEGKPQVSRVEPRVYFNWEMQDPAVTKAVPRDHFSVRWSGYLHVNESGEYKLGAIRAECHGCGRNDAARLYIDDRLLASDLAKANDQMFAKTAPVSLEAGKSYKLRVDYNQNGGGGGIQLVWMPPADGALKEAVDTANKSDLAVLFVGLNSRLEGEESKLVIPGFDGGDRTDIRLPEPQRNLVKAVLDTGKPTVVVLVNGSALAVDVAKERAQAIIEAWYGGQEAGTAIANTITGKNNPAGRLPITFYKSLDQVPPFTDYSMQNRTYRYFKEEPLYPFGYGLSYSNFKYSSLKVGAAAGERSEVSAEVTNSSSRDGDEVAQLYLSHRDGSNPELRGFQRIHLKSGEMRMIRFEVKTAEMRDRTVSVGGGQPLKQWTGDHFIQKETATQSSGSNLSPPVKLTAEQDHQRIMDLLHISSLRPGADGRNTQAPNAANYDESKANPYPNLPDPLTLTNGERVTTPEMWWKQRRPEIVEDFDREVYGRAPKKTPKVNWEVTSTIQEKNGNVPVITKKLVGHVDNSSYPLISLDVQLTLTTPANAARPVPVMMEFGFVFPPGFKFPNGAAPQPNPGPTWQQQVLAKGWGYAVLIPTSIQADNGAGLTQGIIGLVNQGQPRKLDDWGALRAWAWGASRALDYFATDTSVDAKQVGIEGHSRYGKAALVAMAYDPRFAIAFVSSSGEGGAKLNRRNWGELVGNVAGTSEYHWMAGNFLKYAGPLTWNDLPVDSHELIALCAPRPVFISAGATNGDGWADAKGMFMAAVGAGPVYKLLGKRDLGTTEFPPIETPLIGGDVAFRQHSGGHTPMPNWPTFLTFAGRYIKNAGTRPPPDIVGWIEFR